MLPKYSIVSNRVRDSLTRRKYAQLPKSSLYSRGYKIGRGCKAGRGSKAGRYYNIERVCRVGCRIYADTSSLKIKDSTLLI